MRILLRSLPIHIWWCQFRVKMNIEVVTYHWKWFHLVYFIHYNLLSGVKPSILTSNQNSYCRHFLSLPTTFFYASSYHSLFYPIFNSIPYWSNFYPCKKVASSHWFCRGWYDSFLLLYLFTLIIVGSFRIPCTTLLSLLTLD